MSRKIECKSRTLFVVHRNAYASKIASSLTLFSTRTESHMSSKSDFNTRNVFGMHRNAYASKIASSLALYSARTENAHVEWDWLQHSYSIRQAQNVYVKWDWIQVSCPIRHAHKTHMLSKVDFKSFTLSGTHRKLTCRVSLTTTLVLHSAHIKRTCRVRLTTTLVFYSACTKMHMSREIAQVFNSIRHAQKRIC